MKLNIVFTAILIISAPLFTGCASQMTTQQLYAMKEPVGGSQARLRVIADSGVVAIPERDCLDWGAEGSGTVYANGILGSKGFQGRSLGMPNPPNSDLSSMGEMYIAADKPITLHYLYSGSYSCIISVSFTPKAEKDYEATMKYDSKLNTCYALVSSLGVTREPVQAKRAERCKS